MADAIGRAGQVKSIVRCTRAGQAQELISPVLGRQALLRINARLGRVADGNFGDVKPVRDGISELRIDYGPGYRVYFIRHGPMVIVLLAGGAKGSPDADIARALKIAKEWKEEMP